MTTRARIIKAFIGRFQPFHKGHLQVLKAACATADRVVVLIGSANKPASTKNPWSYAARESMIRLSLTKLESDLVSIYPADDVPGDDAMWVKSVKDKVRNDAREHFPTGPLSFTLIGCHKDASSYYLKLYKGWKLELVPHSDTMDATTTRQRLFMGQTNWAEDLPPASAAYLAAFKEYQRGVFVHLSDEWEKERHEKAKKAVQDLFWSDKKITTLQETTPTSATLIEK